MENFQPPRQLWLKICPFPCISDSIAHQLIDNGKLPNANKKHALSAKQECSKLWNDPGTDKLLSAPFTPTELSNAIKQLKCSKAQGPDNIAPEFIKHCGRKYLTWLREFYSTCLNYQVIPKIWRKASVIALPEPNKALDDPKSYRSISLLCVPYKIHERLIMTRLEPVIDPQLPEEQAGFRHGRCTTD